MILNEGSLGTIEEARTGTIWSPADLTREVARRAGILGAAGVARGQRVLIRHGGTASFFADLFAVWRCGACAVCLNPGTTDPELQNIAAFTEAAVVLLAESSPRPTGSLPMLVTETTRGPAGEFAGANLDDDALILFTSGTTGTPKGVVHTFRSLLARVALNRAYIGDADLARTLCVLPTHFGHGLIGNSLTPLLAGHTLVLGTGTDVRSATALGALLDERNVSFLSSVPSFWKLVLRVSKPPTRGTLRRIHIGSAPLSADLWDKVRAWAGTDHIFNMYGITETANWISGASAAAGTGDGRIGHVWGGTAAVRTSDGRIAGRGDGELAVQTPSLMREYFRRPELTAEVLHDGWFFTGDIGRIDTDGSIWLTGRQKYEINRGGLKVHPEDIDTLLECHPDVQEACAFAIPDEVIGEAVGVALALTDGKALDLKALKAWAAERLAREKLPDRWYVLREIPKNDRGKVSRDHVAALCRDLAAAS